MKKYYLFIAVFNFAYNSITNAQFIPKIPFELCNNRLIIEHTLKGLNKDMCFDTGSNINIINTTTNSFPNYTSNKNFATMSLGVFDLNLITIDNIKDSLFGDIWAGYERSISLKSDCNIDGILNGSLLFNKFVIEINFINKHINILSDSVLFLSLKHNIKSTFQLDHPAKDYETLASKFISNFISISGLIQFQDSSHVKTQFLIDTGSNYEIALVVSDSSLIKKYSLGKVLYENDFFNVEKEIDYTYVSYNIGDNTKSQHIKTLMFFSEPSLFSIFGSRKIGVLLGVPFFIKYNSLVIDYFDKKLYLYN
ncbi:MAG: hypothetical protein RBR97_18685 [Bacteroidales bacterium]|nr:hypothetical protein [Bacteroidales bacterium]